MTRNTLRTERVGLRKTMTCDQGSELALHQQLSAAPKIDIYFCDAHSPWQRGANAATNGLVREFLPKGMDLSLLPEVLLGAQPIDQPNLDLASEGVQRYVWQSACGAMLIEVCDGIAYVNGARVLPIAELRAADA